MSESLSTRDAAIVASNEQSKDLDLRRAAARELSDKIADAERQGKKSACGPVPILVQSSDDGTVVISPDSFQPPVLKYGMAKGNPSTADKATQKPKI